ncbi:MAG: hypothetical protein M3P95_02655 [Actinomycetota bacterium]|nr:hypothetical protein [Actinomycetota bacterium]
MHLDVARVVPAALSGAAPVTVPPAPAYGTRMDIQVSRGGLAGVPVTARYATPAGGAPYLTTAKATYTYR